MAIFADLLPTFVPIPAGTFLMGIPERELSALAKRFGGTRESYAEEAPQHMVTLTAYEIAQVPVTNRVYAVWIEYSSSRPPITWHGSQPPAALLDLPVVDVTWDEAQAFCAWLRNAINQPVRLPTEAEWEYAARGADGRMWPWGNDFDATRANVAEAACGCPTPVGVFASGASPFGVLDLAGNVWEWTASLQVSYPYKANDGRESLTPVPALDRRRIMRGGCWANPGHFARTTCRFRLPPDRSTHLLGFRLARG